MRRYGVTVASYTWTMLRDLVNAPRHPGEAHHPVRLFIGSGMPPGLWRRVMSRFAPARVLEFYASSEGEGVLVNLSGTKAGALGRPLPGSAEVRLAAYDLESGRLVEADGGYALRCPPGEVGLLLARTDPAANGQGEVLRSVFGRDDAWLSTGDLLRQDADGDFWLVDHAESVVRTAAGPVPSVPIRDAAGDATRGRPGGRLWPAGRRRRRGRGRRGRRDAAAPARASRPPTSTARWPRCPSSAGPRSSAWWTRFP